MLMTHKHNLMSSQVPQCATLNVISYAYSHFKHFLVLTNNMKLTNRECDFETSRHLVQTLCKSYM